MWSRWAWVRTSTGWGRTEMAGALPRSGSRFPQRPARAQTRDQASRERATPLDEQRLVDGLMTDAHELIIGEVDPGPEGDLFRAPRRRPSPVLPVRLCSALSRQGSPGPQRSCRRVGGRSHPAAPAHTHETCRRSRASLSSGASLPIALSTAPPRPGRPACRHWSPSCDGARKRPCRGRV